MRFAGHAWLLVIVLGAMSAPGQFRFRPPDIKKETPPVQTRPAVPGSVTVSAADSARKDVEIERPPLPVPDSIIIPQLDFSNQPIGEVMRLLSATYGLNIAVAPDVSRRLTLRLTDISLKDALEFIIRESGCDYTVRNNIIKIFKPVPLPPAPPPPPPEPKQTLRVDENGRVHADLTKAPLDSVVRWIADRLHINCIPEKGMRTPISAFFTDLEKEKALSVLFETNGIEVSEKDGLRYLFPVDETNGEEKGGAPRSRMRHRVTVENGRVSLDVRDAPINAIVQEVARQADLQMYLYRPVEGVVTANAEDMSVDELFEGLLRNTSSTFWYSRGIYYFGSREMHDMKVVDMIHVNYLQAADVIPLLPAAVGGKATMKVVKEYNAILIEAPTSDLIDMARNFIAELDKPVAQVLIEAWVVEVKLGEMRKFGLELYTDPNAGSKTRRFFPSFSGEYSKSRLLGFMEEFLNINTTGLKKVLPDDFAMNLDLLESEGVTNLISKPQIATLNGHSATINFGTTEYYLMEKESFITSDNDVIPVKDQRWEKVTVDMTLTVKPWVSSKDEVTIEISPRFDVPGPRMEANMPPPINRRSLKSTVRVKDGEMIVLGGLIGESVEKNLKKVPFLGSVPILKWFFSTTNTEKSKTQLMIYLIPHIYYGSERSIDPEDVTIKKFSEDPYFRDRKEPRWRLYKRARTKE